MGSPCQAVSFAQTGSQSLDTGSPMSKAARLEWEEISSPSAYHDFVMIESKNTLELRIFIKL